jgi:hypothetical protein
MNEDFVHKVNDNNTENNDLKHKITTNRVDLFYLVVLVAAVKDH